MDIVTIDGYSEGGEYVLNDCLEIFKQELKRAEAEGGNPDKLILDTYIPADGIYVIVQSDNKVKWAEIKYNKKTKKLEHIPVFMDQIRRCDYYSQLVNMDKPQDPKKTIHSNNYLSFWVKQDSLKNGKMDVVAIERYFDVLANPKKKYKKPKDREMYQYIESQIGEIDIEKLRRNQKWIEDHIFNLADLDVELSGKGYLKIFFEYDEELYMKESKRYLITKIYNKNDYNININGTIFGLPDNNMGMNAKKPYMEYKTKKIVVPYLVDLDNILLHKKFFDYLMNMASSGKTNLFFDMRENVIMAYPKDQMVPKDFTGFFLQIQKDKEVKIQHQDTIVDYRFHFPVKFKYHNYIGAFDKDEIYKEYGDKKQMQAILDEVLYSKWLITNYFTPVEDLQLDGGELKRTLVRTRDAVFAWLYKGQVIGIDRILKQACLNMTKSSIGSGYLPKAKKQFNLLLSFEEFFEGGKEMDQTYDDIKDGLREKINQKVTQKIESKEEYYYAVGQLVNYFISLNKSKEKQHSLANPFFNAVSDDRIKEKLRQFFVKYNYQLNYGGRRFNNLYAMISAYKSSGKVDQTTIIAGYLSSNLIYESNKEGQDNE